MIVWGLKANIQIFNFKTLKLVFWTSFPTKIGLLTRCLDFVVAANKSQETALILRL